MADDSKTEKATPKKRRDERKKGNVLMSRDVVAVATLFASVTMIKVWFPTMVVSIREFIEDTLILARDVKSAVPHWIFLRAIELVAKATGPLLAAAVLSAVAATFAQTKLLVTTEPLKPKLDRISPLQGFKRLFSLRSVVEAVKGILKIIILLYFVYSCLKDTLSVSPRYLSADVMGVCQHLLKSMFSMLMKVGVAFLALAAVDFLYQWWDYERKLRMSKQEIKEEYKQTEGDPQIKSKIKEVQRKMAQSRMMQQVPQSDVVVRNPTHFAVALRYHIGEDNAPVVLAKGQDGLALRIVRVAEENNVTVIENVPLARALYAETEINSQIPPSLYDSVAEIMVYLYKLGKLHKKSDK